MFLWLKTLYRKRALTWHFIFYTIIWTLSTNHDNNFAIAVTNDRIIAGQKKLMGENLKTITRRNLNDISKTTGMIWGILTIDTIKEKLNIATNKPEIDAIYNGVNKIMFQDEITISKATSNTSTKSPIEELKE